MTTEPRFIPAKTRFLDATERSVSPAVTLVGVPFDGTVSFKTGARLGPGAVREASHGLETYSPAQDVDYTDFELVDRGDLDLSGCTPPDVLRQVESVASTLLLSGATPLLLGGEHSVSIGAVYAVHAKYPQLCLVQFDAHADLRQSYLGTPLNHACTIKRCLDRLESTRVLQLGIRSGTRDEYRELRESGRYVPADPALFSQRIAAFGGRPIYLTLDLDLFDPAFCPGTGTPEPGGIDWPLFEALLEAIPAEQLIAADVVELAPQLDASGASSILAAKVVRELIIKLARGRDLRRQLALS